MIVVIISRGHRPLVDVSIRWIERGGSGRTPCLQVVAVGVILCNSTLRVQQKTLSRGDGEPKVGQQRLYVIQWYFVIIGGVLLENGRQIKQPFFIGSCGCFVCRVRGPKDPHTTPKEKDQHLPA